MWKDSFYNKLSVLYNVVPGEGEYIFLQKITFIDVTTMDLTQNSKIYTYVALVKAATQELTVFFQTNQKEKYYQEQQKQKGKNAVKKFKPIHSFNISIKSDKRRCLLNLPNLVVKTLSRYDIISKKYIKMYFINHVVKVAGGKHKSKWLQA